MSKKRKPQPETETQVKSEVVTFREFFHSSLFRGKVQNWQEKEIHAFFKDLGLTDKEPLDAYKIALAKF